MTKFGSSDAGKLGGKARAKSLSPEERSRQAKAAAAARWNVDVPRAACEGEFNIGKVVIRAAVLPNGKRLLTQSTFMLALGRSRTPKAGTGVMATAGGLPFFLQAEVLQPFIDEELAQAATPIFFIGKEGRRQVGYDAELLPRVADVYLQFRDRCLERGESVPRAYSHIVTACDVVTRGLARVGIIALVDEATGFQDERAKNALATILEQFVATELRKWVKTFPLDYYRQLCRLKGVAFAANMRLPQYFGHITNDVVYSRLAPGVLEALRQMNPAADGRRKHKHFQYLTDDVGNPNLLMYLGSIVSLMKLSSTYEEFKEKLDKIHPRHRALPLFDSIEDQ